MSARTPEGEIMGVRHRALLVEGVQFHPESILTPEGPRLMGNFLRLSAPVHAPAGRAEQPCRVRVSMLGKLLERRRSERRRRPGSCSRR